MKFKFVFALDLSSKIVPYMSHHLNLCINENKQIIVQIKRQYSKRDKIFVKFN